MTLGDKDKSRLFMEIDTLKSMVNALAGIVDNSEPNLALGSMLPPGIVAKRLYSQRRMRTKAFGTPTLFGEPAWDILLDLYIHRAAGRRASVKSACVGSAVPASTALRWLCALEDRGLIESSEDNDDQRRRFVQLTNTGFEIMDGLLSDPEFWR